MHRIDNSRFLLYIEPKKEEKLESPIDDEISEIMKIALSESKEGSSNYSRNQEEEKFKEGNGFLGTHLTDCGERSSNRDYLLKNGMITNSLCVFYLRYYRNSIPKTEMDKVMRLVEFYKNKLKVGDKVVKNEETWKSNDFDAWGRGVGVGVVVEPPFQLDEGEVDVKWPNGRCFEFVNQLKKNK